MVDRNDKRFFDFMCSCKEEGKQECEKVYNDVMESFRKENEERSEDFKREITDRDFVDLIVHGLDYMKNGSAYINAIHTDMWSGISIEYQYNFKEYDFDNCKVCNDEEREDEPDCEHGWKIQDFWIECDRIHHGLARAYQLVKEFDESL